MEHLINSRVKNIEISGIRKFFNFVADFEDVISLTIGQPDFHTPNHIKDAGIESITKNYTTYTPNAGDLALRRAASTFVLEKYRLQYDPENEVIVTIGASQAIDIAFRTILEEGTEVILPGPVYPGYEPIIKLCGAKAIHVDTTMSDFKLTAKSIEEHITEKTRCIVLPYPSNPTGVTLTPDELEEIAALLKDKNIFVLSDEIYSELVFTGRHHSIASYLPNKTIVINGLSKSHSMTGWRIGFLFAPSYLVKHILKVHQYNVSCASSISQKAAYEALTNGKNDAIPMKDTYRQRLEYVESRLEKIGLPVTKPTGAFYIFPSIKQFQLTSYEFAIKLVTEARVAVVPGSAFSSYGEDYIRLSYAYSMETLTEGLNRIENFVLNY
ncbi:aminotransferase A [Cytobacillus sp. IB215665]|uniref:aminotransferase A n=1 Tax=Cytobacillus sp. IB215665 TaxID=3097357 RepID=UPI002A138A57|nr:aminotransferase A [Cytobacillus sp. IB215665]MDX8366440.1 aminotransferase A [Cytobacillus sp. IB215665]